MRNEIGIRTVWSYLSQSGLKLVIESPDDETIKGTAGQIRSSQSKEIISFSFKEINLDIFVSAISLFSKYAGFESYEMKSTRRGHTIVFHHELDRKWSFHVAHLISESKGYTCISPRFQIAENSVIFEFLIP